MSFHKLNAELERWRACENRETDEARARTRGAPCYGGTEHVADKRAPLFKEKRLGGKVRADPTSSPHTVP